MKKFIIALIGTLLLSTLLVEAKPKKEVQSAVLPSTTVVYEGVTRNGNPKYWVELKQGNLIVKVTISKSNAEKLQKGEEILIIKWVDENGKYSYSTRCKDGKKGKMLTPNIDLSTL